MAIRHPLAFSPMAASTAVALGGALGVLITRWLCPVETANTWVPTAN